MGKYGWKWVEVIIVVDSDRRYYRVSNNDLNIKEARSIHSSTTRFFFIIIFSRDQKNSITTVCWPWSATFRNMIKYFVEK